MITQDELKQHITTTIGKLKVVELSKILDQEKFALRDLIDLTFNADKHIAFRAAWILENLFLNKPETYEHDLEYLLARMPGVKHKSCQRHYVKILMHITAPGAPAVIKNKVEHINLLPVVEMCFDWLIDPKVKIAVKVFACRALFNLRDRHSVIKEELEDQIKFLMRAAPSPGILSRGKKILTELYKKH